MSRKTSKELVAARLALNTPDGFVISKPVIADFIDEILELRMQVAELQEGIKQLVSNSLYRQVREFHIKYGHPVAYTPKVVSEELIRFRLRLIAEEFFELLDASFGSKGELNKVHVMDDINTAEIVQFNFPEFIDALGDLDYVIEGSRATFGVHGGPIAIAIHNANMAKDPNGPNGKPAKPLGWTPPDIPGELRKQGWEPE